MSELETITVKTIEAGYAEVLNAFGRRMGTLSRDKWGSTRTGTRWFAYRGKVMIGSADTRAEAAALIVKHRADAIAKAVAFIEADAANRNA